jgi:Uma2 family endonuclease
MAVNISSGKVISGISGEVIATGVSFEEYLERYAADHCEWVGGTVIKMSPIHDFHDVIVRYLAILFETYFELRPIGLIRQDPFLMRLPAINVSREPDIQVILSSNPHELTPTYMNGPADICIEVVSPESVSRDHGEKLSEYEKGGVGEYWIMDYLHRECRFFRLNAEGQYVRISEDVDGNYTTPLLPGLVLHVLTLWQANLPGPLAIGQAVQAMLKKAE